QETRKSIRQYGSMAITLQQVGEFLYRVGRVLRREKLAVSTPQGPIDMEFAFRPYPSGGALYELELYLAVGACDALEAGLYHYDSQHHQLGRISDSTPNVTELLLGASQSTAIPQE